MSANTDLQNIVSQFWDDIITDYISKNTIQFEIGGTDYSAAVALTFRGGSGVEIFKTKYENTLSLNGQSFTAIKVVGSSTTITYTLPSTVTIEGGYEYEVDIEYTLSEVDG